MEDASGRREAYTSRFAVSLLRRTMSQVNVILGMRCVKSTQFLAKLQVYTRLPPNLVFIGITGITGQVDVNKSMELKSTGSYVLDERQIPVGLRLRGMFL